MDAFSFQGRTGQVLTYQAVRHIPLENVIGTQGVTTPTGESFTFPKTHSYSVSYARRLFWDQVVEAAYVGTTGRDLVSKTNSNVVPYGALTRRDGRCGLSVPLNRMVLDPGLVNSLRSYPAYARIIPNEYEGRQQYHSLQVTLSRQTSRRLQFFVAYRLSRSEGTLSGEWNLRDPFNPKYFF